MVGWATWVRDGKSGSKFISIQKLACGIPSSIQKYVVQKLTPNFREAVQLITAPMKEPGQGEILVKNSFVGINALDINYTAARYDSSLQPPFDCGFEGVGEVVAVGPGCKKVKVGQAVGYSMFGAFADYTAIPEKLALLLPSARPEFLTYLVSGLTAGIALDIVGEIQSGETVLVTAAAGGTGQFAVQWAKNRGCYVIGTCSTDEKVDFLRSIGCDRPINYNNENFKTVMQKEFPKGVDVIYESVGGEIFNICVNSLALKGRFIVIGFIQGYESAAGVVPVKTLTPALVAKLLVKSASLRGFFMNHYTKFYPEYMKKMFDMQQSGALKPAYDNGKNSSKGPFKGLESVPDAVDYLCSRKSVGKIVVDLQEAKSKL